MILIKNIVLKFIFLFIIFFIFNLEEIDSNSDKRVIYNLNNIYEEEYFTLYLKDVNSNKLKEVAYELDIDITSYIINDKKYYARDMYELIDIYTRDLPYEDTIYYNINGIRIDAITTRCEVYKVMKLESYNLIY